MVNGFEVVDVWAGWPLTPRTRYMLWRSLQVVTEHLSAAVELWRDEGAFDFAAAATDADCYYIADFPVNTRSQPLNWWSLMVVAAERMTEAMRTGEKWNPRTPAEEAVLFVSIIEIDVIKDMVLVDREPTYTKELAALPDEGGQDYEFGEALGALCQDTDIETIFDQSADGIGDPENAINQELGMGDYTLVMWHSPFDCFVAEPDMTSFLG